MGWHENELQNGEPASQAAERCFKALGQLVSTG